jgi:MtrB/PioB family decaheme-associated outer membrane protein
MKAKLLPLLIANLFCASTVALAQEGGFKVTGSAGVSGIAIDEDSNDASKLNEYRDLSAGGAAVFDLRGRGGRYFFDGFGENIGRDDMYVDFRGGSYGQFKYRLYSDWLRHNFGFGPDGGRTPYINPGDDRLTFFSTSPAARANSNVPPWTAFDYRTFRKDTGGNFEFSGASPWYARFDANEVRQTGIDKANSAALGTSPGNGFIDLPYPVEYVTRNFMAEAGYQAPQGHLSVNWTQSRFQNENVLLGFQNSFFGNGYDTATFAPDNDYMKLGASGVLRRLPLASSLSGRVTYSEITNSANTIAAVLNTAGSAALVPTNPSTSTFDGKVKNTTAQFGLSSLPARNLDSRVYYNYYKRENDSTEVTYRTLTAGLSCFAPGTTGPGNVNVFCTSDRYGYTKHNPGFELGFRINAENRLSGGYDYLSTERERFDADKTRDNRFFVQWSNSTFETVALRLRYQYLHRRSDFQTDDAGFNANSPFYLERFNRAFDVADVNQNLIKAFLDWSPMPFLDFGFEAYYKKNDYKNLTLGRTKDDRKEFYASVGYGDPSVFRVTLFGDIEFIEYDSYHRTISTVAGNGACTAAAPNCFDPGTAPTAQNYNWGSTLDDTNWMVGVGADWPLMARLLMKASAIVAKTDGTVDFQPQTLANGSPAANLPPINAYDNTRRTSFTLRAVWQADRNWELSGGYAYERYKYDDAQYENYRYTVGTGTSTSYLSGIGAFQDYKANILFGTVRYKF